MSANENNQFNRIFSENELPDGWLLKKLRDVVNNKKGKLPKQLNENPWKRSVPHIDIDAFERGKINRYSDRESGVIVQKGDLIVVWDGARCGLIGKAPFEGSLGSTLMLLKPNQINADFLFFILRNYYKIINTNPRGIGIPHVEPDIFWNLDIPLPPLDEQQRIVARIDTLLVHINAARERLGRVPLLMKKFRQGLLAVACSGRLTEEWRNCEQEWEIVQFDNLLERNPQNGLYLPQSKYGKGYPIIRIDDFHNGNLKSWTSLKRVDITSDLADKYSLEKDDILINRVNSMKFLGKSVLITKPDEKSVFECNMIRFKVDKTKVSPNFAILYLMSSNGVAELQKNAKHAVNQSSINQSDIRSIQFPLPPLAEQHEIVRRVEGLFARADAIDREVAAAMRRAEVMTHAVLAKAFKGELVPSRMVEGEA